VPVLLVHGIWDSSSRLAPLRAGLERRGIGPVHAVDLVPNDGRAPIAELGGIVAREATELAEREGASRVDVVGFSMGALVARWYIQRGGGKAKVRRFVSISGPHAGTAFAYALPFAGVRDMRPGSPLLRDLAADADPFGDVEVHCLYTPFDLMILPPTSSVLAGARSVGKFRVPMHRFMITSSVVLDHVAEILRAPDG
jgi:triacylglycerol esterase/lipase EstA (alpha/beta hydrolase family)